MVRAGLIEEVKTVTRLVADALGGGAATSADTPQNPAEGAPYEERTVAPSLQAIGYKEIARHLAGEMTLEEAISLVKKASKRYAKRQLTWFRKEEDIHWIDITGLDDPGIIFDRVSPVIARMLGTAIVRPA